MKYFFVFFLNYDFEKLFQIVLMGLQKNLCDVVFNCLVMYNYIDLKCYDEVMKVVDVFFKEFDKVDFFYFDYMYFGYLFNVVKKYDQVVEVYMKVIMFDFVKIDLWCEVFFFYELNNEFVKVIEVYKKYSELLSVDKCIFDVQF